MADDISTATFWTQADALLRKNLTYQKRNKGANCRLICFPFFFCMILFGIQKITLMATESDRKDTSSNRCGSSHFSDLGQWLSCPIPSPPKWPPLLQVPLPEYRAVRSSAAHLFKDLPDQSCRLKGKNCPVTTLITGTNQTLAQTLAGNMFQTDVVLGSASEPSHDYFIDSAFLGKDSSLYNIQSQCGSNSTISVSVTLPRSSLKFQKDAVCVRNLNLWRNSSIEINNQIYMGHEKGNAEGKSNEILGAYDFLNSNGNNFNVNVWYNATYKDASALRLPRAVNLATNAYLQLFKGLGAKVTLEFIKEMPKTSNAPIKFDIASQMGTLFFTWVILQLFPVVLTSLVYERQQKLRIMMKMHGLGDGPYWMISYMYFLSISALYMFVFVAFGSLIGLKFFTLNDYSIQFLFYFLYINLQISLALLVSAFFSNIKTATVTGYLCVFGSGLLGEFLFKFFIEDTSFPKGWIVLIELYPGFALYRGLYEFGEYASTGSVMDTDGMKWVSLSDSDNGMMNVMIIMLLEWLLVLLIAYYVDQVFSCGSGKHPKYLLQIFRKKGSQSSFQKPSLHEKGSKVFVDMDKPDVIQEREKVAELLLEPTTTHGIICENLRKVYPGRDGNPEKLAVKGLSLAIPRGECLGMLGPNGAGKTSFISMMIGLTTPTSGAAYIDGLDIQTQMDSVYTRIGVCPQHDLLWDTLTGREHLLFYGRLKNLKGSALKRAVEESLKSLKLFDGGVADKHAGKYSGGMKRRLSVAISLIGDPKVVYMDEPSTGLDPASRSTLWNVVKRAKQDKAIVLTTHSMEEAEYLCDRVGFYVSGSLVCIGNPKELKARYGGTYVFIMTTSVENENEVENMVRGLSPNSERTYHLAGTQKFEMPKHEVSIADVFHTVEVAKARFHVYAWGLSDTTLEDVFIKVTNSAEQSHSS